jgi:hypothetical protein
MSAQAAEQEAGQLTERGLEDERWHRQHSRPVKLPAELLCELGVGRGLWRRQVERAGGRVTRGEKVDGAYPVVQRDATEVLRAVAQPTADS